MTQQGSYLFTTEAIVFNRATNEGALGHVRRFRVGEYAGTAVFGFHGERENREYFLELGLAFGGTHLESVVYGESATDVVETMHHATDLGWLLGQTVFEVGEVAAA
ncbi:MAG TPA: hypothetical protein VG992_02345 [Candidatus Saccharimonadales bacterium]|nr:hypothetical protein [Candidatus Saccharimonadales bacterium]